MHKDFKTAKPTDSGYKTGMPWMLAGVFMGLLAGLGMYFYANHPSSIFADANAATSEGGVVPRDSQVSDAIVTNPTNAYVDPLLSALEEPKPPKRAVFDYQAVLPTLSIPVTPRQKAVAGTAGAKIKKRPVRSGDLFLQVASFKSRTQAKQSQRKLNKRGVTARIEKHSSKGKVWYRVLAGPIETMKLPDWKKQVKKLGYDPIVRKAK